MIFLRHRRIRDLFERLQGVVGGRKRYKQKQMKGCVGGYRDYHDGLAMHEEDKSKNYFKNLA